MANLLLVDDDEELAEVFAEVLRAVGHTVRLARNGEEALAALAEEHPEVILCDLEMPVLDGAGLILRLLALDAGLERIPIVITSGVADLRRIATQLGTPYFAAKPFMVDKLLAVLNRALTERRPPLPRPSPSK